MQIEFDGSGWRFVARSQESGVPARRGQESEWVHVGLGKIVQGMTRFGRIGVLYDHSCEEMPHVLEAFSVGEYIPKQPKRAEKSPRITPFPTQLLHHMAMEGWGDSVEFRRIARKYLKRAKNHNCDTVFFPETIFAERATAKVLQHLAGTQMKVVTMKDVPGSQPWLEDVTIDPELSPFERKRVEEILGRKLPKKGM